LYEVGAAVLLHRHDRLAAGTGVAAEREHWYLRVDARAHHVRRVGSDLQFFGAGWAPARFRRPTAPAFEREDEIEHV
jgi:hypothetical protein